MMRRPIGLDTVRDGRAPEDKKQTLTEQLDAELESILAVRPDLEVVAIADGAEANWRYFDRPLYAEATRIVDHGHASEHLRAAMTAYYGDKSVEGRAEYARLRLILRDQPGGVGEVITELGRLSRKLGGSRRKARRKRLNSELTYFTNQRERMDYADYQARGKPPPAPTLLVNVILASVNRNHFLQITTLCSNLQKTRLSAIRMMSLKSGHPIASAVGYTGSLMKADPVTTRWNRDPARR